MNKYIRKTAKDNWLAEILWIILFSGVFLFSNLTSAQPSETDFQRTLVRQNMDLTSEFEISRDGRIFIVGKCGALYGWNLDDDSNFATSTVPNVRCDFEDGVLSIALDPNFVNNAWVYIQYTAPGSITRVSRFTMNSDNSLDTASESIVLQWTTGREAFGHMGGSLHFAPDGNLFISTGDNHAATGYYNQNARDSSGNTNDLRGKVLRIRPTTGGSYTIPAGNLFATDSTHRGEIYGMGFRNPYRITVDQETGWVYLGDIGPDASGPNGSNPGGLDEINQLRTPGNYGWPFVIGYNQPYEGFDPNNLRNEDNDNTGAVELPNAIGALWTISHRAIMVGPLYRYDPSIEDSRKLPEYYDGKLLYWNFNSSNFFAMSMDANGENPTIESLPIDDDLDGAIDAELDPRTHQLYVLQWGNGCCAMEPYGRGALYRYDFIGDRAPLENISLNRPATASSDVGGNTASDAFDGNPSTRWESEFSDPHWLQVDLGQPYTIGEIAITWEGAYSSAYQIEGSNDQLNWDLLADETNGSGGTELISIPSTNAYQYIRLTGTARGTVYGHSIYEFAIFESDSGNPTATPTPTTLPGNAYLNMPQELDAQFTNVPTMLSDTGAFTDTVNLVPAVHIIPYQPNSKLWSDRAVKDRWISLPDGTQIDWNATENWAYPAGSVAIKHFELPIDDNNPTIRKRLETRLLVMQANGRVYGVTYKWNEAGTDATLLTDGLLEDITITGVGGEDWVQTWVYPSPTECIDCHNPESSQFLGLSTRQLNGDFNYPGSGIENQLAHINDLGRFNPSFNNTAIATFDQTVDIEDESATLEMRVKSYLDANCAHCHGTGNGGSQWDARFNTPLNEMRIVDEATTGIRDYFNDYGIENAMLVSAQNPEESVLFIRDRSTDNGDVMPPFGRLMEHVEYITVLEQWINSLPAEFNTTISIQSPANNQIYTESENVSLYSVVDDANWFNSGASYQYSVNGANPIEVTSDAAVNLGSFNPGEYTITVQLLDPQGNAVGDTMSRNFVVVNESAGEPILLSLGRPATSSSNQGPLAAAWTVDGDRDTRWGSEQSDNQWLQIDLESAYNITNIVISWEAAYAREYTIEGSLDGSSWTTIVDQNEGMGCLELHDQLSGSYRYIRLNAEIRGTEWGVSIWEMQVFGSNNP